MVAWRRMVEMAEPERDDPNLDIFWELGYTGFADRLCVGHKTPRTVKEDTMVLGLSIQKNGVAVTLR